MLQADKHVNMGVFLAAKQSEKLSGEALARAQGYLDQAVRTAGELKSQGKEVPPHLMERFVNAGAKYTEVLTELATKASDTYKATIMSLIESVRMFVEEAAKLK